jgi:penicillin-binding protein 2
MKPHVVKEIRTSKKNEIVYRHTPEAIVTSSIDAAHFELIVQSMRGVVTEGTARWGGAILSAESAGKTSTSEVQGMNTHSWYTAFAPYDRSDPERVIAVTAIIEYGGAGSTTAAPIVAQVIEAYFSGSDLDTARRNIWKKRAEVRERARERAGEQAQERETADSGT